VAVASAAISISVIGGKLAATGAPLLMPHLLLVGAVCGLAAGAVWYNLPASKKPLSKEDIEDLGDIVLATNLSPTGKTADLMEVVYETVLGRQYVEHSDLSSDVKDEFPTTVSAVKSDVRNIRDTTLKPVDDCDDGDWIERQYQKDALSEAKERMLARGNNKGKYAGPYIPKL
jgi:hypothetical protein